MSNDRHELHQLRRTVGELEETVKILAEALAEHLQGNDHEAERLTNEIRWERLS